MKRIFCTLFDSRYLSRGLALFESLREWNSDFELYVFAFDELALKTLKLLNCSKMTIISLKEFEDGELKALKPTRSIAEYCWTCTPSIIAYVLKNYSVEECTYLDADLYFFSSVEEIFKELGNQDVLITPHRYTLRYDQSQTSGIYCVQFMTFRKTINGLRILEWWRRACNEWCFARHEDGKFGDQKYLDDWTERFEGVHVLAHLGAGVAPWNVQQYQIFSKAGQKYIQSLINPLRVYPFIFYHFHEFRLNAYEEADYGGYDLNEQHKTLIYKVYYKHIRSLHKKLKSIDLRLAPFRSKPLKLRGKELLKNAQRMLISPLEKK